MNTNIELVIFDCDGVVIDNELSAINIVQLFSATQQWA